MGFLFWFFDIILVFGFVIEVLGIWVICECDIYELISWDGLGDSFRGGIGFLVNIGDFERVGKSIG